MLALGKLIKPEGQGLWGLFNQHCPRLHKCQSPNRKAGGQPHPGQAPDPALWTRWAAPQSSVQAEPGRPQMQASACSVTRPLRPPR